MKYSQQEIIQYVQEEDVKLSVWLSATFSENRKHIHHA